MNFEAINNQDLTWVETKLAQTLSNGPIPNHVAFILDGNRRWARRNNMEVMEGHKFGMKSCKKVVKFLQAVGTKEMTMYAFSIENFKRSKLEVDSLMVILGESIDDFLNDPDLDVRIRLVGDRSLLPVDLQKKIAEVEEVTKNNTNLVVNLALAYTCRDDLTQSMRRNLLKGTNDITVDQLDKNLYTGPCSDVDILIRTSGETRLSDFLMWETSNSWICFLDKLWPELTPWELLKLILKYQRFHLGKILEHNKDV